MVSIKHKKIVTIPDDPAAASAGMVVSSDWNNVLDFKTAAALILLGRKSAGAGDVEELTASDVRTLLNLVPGLSAGNIIQLDGSGKIDASVLPSIAITEPFEVGSQAAMLALDAQKGDVAIRTDLSKTFILATNSPSTLADWKWMQTPTDVVLAVAGLTGAITAAALKTALAIAVADITDMSVAGRLFVALSSYTNMFNAIKQAATDTATGVVELATNAEAIAGTDTSRAVTPAGLAAAIAAGGGSVIKSIQTGYVNSVSLSSGTGEDAKYIDVTLSAVVASKSVVFFDGSFTGTGIGGGANYYGGATGNNYQTGPGLARLTSSTNLRIANPNAAGGFGSVAGRWTVVEYN